jgi:Domain of unknown function (DUF4440)
VTTDIRELQRAFDDAELSADTDRLNALLADDFMSVGERGVQLDKRQWIARHADFAYLSLERVLARPQPPHCSREYFSCRSGTGPGWVQGGGRCRDWQAGDVIALQADHLRATERRR